MKTQVSVIGATGYAGAELCRLLYAHPYAELAGASSVSFEGKPVSEVYPSYFRKIDTICTGQDEAVAKGEVIFAALPHGLSQELAAKCAAENKIFIDLGADFRLESEEEYQEWYGGTFLDADLHRKAVYGLPELFRDEIAGCRLIANPGCYTTGGPLALAPAVKAGLVETSGIIIDSKSGASGAGRSLSQTTHFIDLTGNFHPYKIASHRHTPEMEQTLSRLSGEKIRLTFVPHLLPVDRGILSTCYARLKDGVSEETLRRAYEEFYAGEPFVRVLQKGKTAQILSVKYTNLCDISLHVDTRTGTFIAVSAIDNMVKGAAGQAIQNMNLACGFEETAGLDMVPPAF